MTSCDDGYLGHRQECLCYWSRGSGRAARSGFQRGQTAKAREGPPCAVTPE